MSPILAWESGEEMGVYMKVMKCVLRAWRLWRDMWQFRWDELTGPDYQKWESKMEIRRRLSGSSRDL